MLRAVALALRDQPPRLRYAQPLLLKKEENKNSLSTKYLQDCGRHGIRFFPGKKMAGARNNAARS